MVPELQDHLALSRLDKADTTMLVYGRYNDHILPLYHKDTVFARVFGEKHWPAFERTLLGSCSKPHPLTVLIQLVLYNLGGVCGVVGLFAIDDSCDESRCDGLWHASRWWSLGVVLVLPHQLQIVCAMRPSLFGDIMRHDVDDMMAAARHKVFELFEDKEELQAMLKEEPDCLGLSEGRTKVLTDALAMLSVITTPDQTAVAIRKVARGRAARAGLSVAQGDSRF